MEHKSPRDEALTLEGWSLKFTASEPRLSEAKAQYKELGFDVVIEPLAPCTESEQCSVCIADSPGTVMAIYTRPASL